MTDVAFDRRTVLTYGIAAALVSRLSSVADAADLGPLNFGYQNTSWGVLGMIAEELNVFKKAGVDVNVFKFDGGKSTRDAMIAGRVDVGTIGATPFIIGATKGQLVGIAMAMYAGKTGAVVAGSKSGIKTVAQLKGRNVASQLGSSIDEIFQNKVLPKYGLTSADVQIVNIPHENQIAALAAGSVDAFAGVEPFPSVAQVEKLGVVLVDFSKFDLAPVILSVNRSVIKHKRSALIAFLRGWLVAVNEFKTNPAKSAQIVHDHFKMQGFSVSMDVIKLMLSKLDPNPDFSASLVPYLADQALVLVARNEIETAPDWSKVIDRHLLEDAMK